MSDNGKNEDTGAVAAEAAADHGGEHDHPPYMAVFWALLALTIIEVITPFLVEDMMAIKVTHLLALSIGAGSLVFFFRFAIGYDLKMLGTYGAVTTAVWALTMPAWSRIARLKGKRFGYFVATAGYSLLTLSWLAAGDPEPLPLLMLRAVGFGAISGGMLPNWHSTMRWPVLSSLMAYSRRSRTVAGLPPMT